MGFLQEVAGAHHRLEDWILGTAPTCSLAWGTSPRNTLSCPQVMGSLGTMVAAPRSYLSLNITRTGLVHLARHSLAATMGAATGSSLASITMIK